MYAGSLTKGEEGTHLPTNNGIEDPPGRAWIVGEGGGSPRPPSPSSPPKSSPKGVNAPPTVLGERVVDDGGDPQDPSGGRGRA